MDSSRTTTLRVTASKVDVITALKMRFPGNLDLQAIHPGGVGVSLSTDSSGSVTLSATVVADRHI